jgi:hypothetical protein
MVQIKIRMKLTDYLERFDILAELMTIRKKKDRAVAEIVKNRESGNTYLSLRKNSATRVLVKLESLNIEDQTMLELI